MVILYIPDIETKLKTNTECKIANILSKNAEIKFIRHRFIYIDRELNLKSMFDPTKPTSERDSRAACSIF